MRRPAMCLCLPLALGAALAGCRGALFLRAAPPANEAQVAEIANVLSTGRWERSAAFDHAMLREGDDPRPPEYRWTFRSVAAAEAEAEPLDAATPEAEQAGSSPSSASATPGSAAGPWLGARTVELDACLARLDGIPPAAREAELALPASGRVLRALAARDDLAGWNASIVLARRFPGRAADCIDVLRRLAVDPPHSGPDTEGHVPDQALSAAAAEAWCRALAASADDPIDGLAPAALLLESQSLPEAARAELFRAVARHAAPARIPSLAAALDDTGSTARAPVELRRAAVEACLVHAALHPVGPLTGPPGGAGGGIDSATDPRWPAALANCQWDHDAVVRRLYARWLAVTKPPPAFRVLQAQLSDRDFSVRDAALDSLGVLGTPEAVAELERQAVRSEELIRAAAVRGLARLGPERLVPHANDESAAVRKAVAAGLGRCPGPRTALVLRELLGDANIQVQGAAVEAIADWPDRLAIPLLLHALQESSWQMRQEGFRQLRRRRRIDEPYRAEGTPAERRAAVARIAGQAGLPTGFLHELQQADLPRAPQADGQQALRIESWLRDLDRFPSAAPEHAAARERLLRLAPRDVALVERLALEGRAPVPPVVLDELLSASSPAHAALRDLASPDVFARRRGAQRLAQIAGAASPSPLVLRRLREALAHEQDRLTWRFAMEAVLPDGSEEGAQIAAIAINHSWPDVRQLGCGYVRRHPSSEAAHWVRPLLDDADRNVQQAAIDAAGRCGNLAVVDDLPGQGGLPPARGLRSLLQDTDRHVRFAAAIALSRLGVEEGLLEMVRLAHDENPAIRIHVVQAMAETGRTRFRGPLVELGWTEPHDRVRRAILAGLERLTPPEQRPPELAQATDDAARIEAWAAWHGERRTSSSGPGRQDL
ncbi:MAG: HEAT repeat domain-containing protein [Planctomycetales bacterium]